MHPTQESTIGALWQRGLAIATRFQHDSLARNGALIFLTSLMTSGLGYFYWLIAAHAYSDYDVGLASALISSMMLVGSLTKLGFDTFVIQNLPRSKTAAEWSLNLNAALIGISVAGLIGAIIALGFLLLSSEYAVPLEQGILIGLFAISVPLTNVNTLQDSAFIAERSAQKMFIHNLVFALVKMLLLVLLIPLALTGNAVFLSWQLSSILAVVVGAMLIRQLGHDYRPLVNGVVGRIRAAWSALAIQYLVNVAPGIASFLMPVLVAGLLSPQQNAYFYPLWLLRSLYSMISVSVAASQLAEGAHDSTQALKQMWQSARIIALTLGPTLLVLLVGGNFFLTMFGSAYATNGMPTFLVLLVSAVPDAITNIYVNFLRVRKLNRAAAALNIFMSAIAVGLSVLLLPRIGLIGAGWAWLIAQSAGTVAAVLHFVWLRPKLITALDTVA